MKCNGEIIEERGPTMICWIQISETMRVRTGLDSSLFAELPRYPEAEFVWDAETGAVSPMDFDNDDIVAEYDRLEREWDEDLKHRVPRMAETLT